MPAISCPPARRLALSVVLALAGAGATAATAAAEPTQLTDASFSEIDRMVKGAKGYPNEEQRLRGLKSYQVGQYPDAVRAFRVAAYHADKFSQHYLSLIRWHGVDAPADRVEAYIWADLAAERGHTRLLAVREGMWAELTPAQRQDVQAQGGEYYDRYGDATARPRADADIRRFMRGMTGSRVGFRNQRLEITQGGPIHGSFGNDKPSHAVASATAHGTTTGEDLYADHRTHVDEYWRDQDRLMDGGTVEVGPVRAAREPGS